MRSNPINHTLATLPEITLPSERSLTPYFRDLRPQTALVYYPTDQDRKLFRVKTQSLAQILANVFVPFLGSPSYSVFQKIDKWSKFVSRKAKNGFRAVANMLKGRESDYANGILYRIRDENGQTRGYLLGTMHVATEQNLALNPKIKSCIEKCSSVSFEMVGGQFPEGSIERAVQKVAEPQLLKQEGLEDSSREANFHKLRNAPDTPPEQLQKEFEEDQKAWFEGDFNYFLNPKLSQVEKEALLTPRDPVMATKMDEKMKNPTPICDYVNSTHHYNSNRSFFAVGADHLAGIKQRLERKNYSFEEVKT